jgi:Protein of avirulence locus involved in temperature-dependent protein secretion
VSKTEAQEHLQAGRLQEALSALRQAVRKSPADASLRIFLFELLSLVGEWEKALTQLQVVGELDPDSFLLAQAFRPAVQCEVLRGEVFSGKRTPLIFGEPEPWVSWLVQANHLIATGKAEASAELRERAFAEAPASAGSINGQSFEWIADGDSRLGPMLEVILEGKYYWIPFARMVSIRIGSPETLRDLIWIPAQFTWSNGGNATGLIPVRYAGTESSSDDALRLSRKTDWLKRSDELFIGVGQRMLATDHTEYPLLEARQIGFESPPQTVSAEMM